MIGIHVNQGGNPLKYTCTVCKLGQNARGVGLFVFNTVISGALVGHCMCIMSTVPVCLLHRQAPRLLAPRQPTRPPVALGFVCIHYTNIHLPLDDPKLAVVKNVGSACGWLLLRLSPWYVISHSPIWAPGRVGERRGWGRGQSGGNPRCVPAPPPSCGPVILRDLFPPALPSPQSHPLLPGKLAPFLALFWPLPVCTHRLPAAWKPLSRRRPSHRARPWFIINGL